MTASQPVDEWTPRWDSFSSFLEDDTRTDPSASYMLELRDDGTRREWTRAEWRDRVGEVAWWLSEHGIAPGRAVAVLAGNSADAIAIAFACWAHGWVYVPLNAHEPVERHQFVLEHARAQVFLYADELAVSARAAGEASGTPTLPLSSVRGTWRSKSPRTPWTTPALRVYTSGTTGEPKGVELTTGNLVTDCDALQLATGWDATARVLVVLPIHHVNGLVVSCLQAWYVGGSVVLCERFRSDEFWSVAARERATTSSLVPTILEFLLEVDNADAAPAGLREIFCGAGPLMTETVLGFEERFGVPVRHLYGLSETTAVATMMPRDLDTDSRRSWYRDHGFPSIGTAVAHVHLAVHDPDGRECPAGQRGEIVIRGGTVMSGYAGRPDATELALRDGWFHTGDEGFWQPDDGGLAYYFVTGRLKELIIRGGVNISPFQVDEVLNAHPAVRFALAVPFENRYYGEEIAAYVVRASEVTEEEILAFCADRLDFAYRPKVVLFGDDVPYTATGKAKRLTLKDQLSEALREYRNVQFRRRQG